MSSIFNDFCNLIMIDLTRIPWYKKRRSCSDEDSPVLDKREVPWLRWNHVEVAWYFV